VVTASIAQYSCQCSAAQDREEPEADARPWTGKSCCCGRLFCSKATHQVRCLLCTYHCERYTNELLTALTVLCRKVKRRDGPRKPALPMPTECVAAPLVPIFSAYHCGIKCSRRAAYQAICLRGRVRRSSRSRRDVNYSEDAVQSAGGDVAWTPPVSSITVRRPLARKTLQSASTKAAGNVHSRWVDMQGLTLVRRNQGCMLRQTRRLWRF